MSPTETALNTALTAEPLRAIVEFSQSTDYSSMRPSTIDAVVRNYIDCVSCGAAGFTGSPTAIGRAIAAETSGPSSVYGLPRPAVTEFAAFANVVATRYADWNDGGIGAGHLSDMSAALMASAEASNASPRDFLTAMYVAYQTAGKFAFAVPLRDIGWDQGLFSIFGMSSALGNLHRMTEEQLVNAVSIAITPAVPLRVARAGAISNWKGVATAHACMTATFAANLARHDMTGPPKVFDGIEGLFDKVTGEFQVGSIAPSEGERSIPEYVHHKYYPAEMNAQAPVQLMLKMRENFAPEDVESITLSTYRLAWHETGGGQGDAAEKWDPHTRETADHSLPYYLAVVLADGTLSLKSFELERINDPALRPILRRISVLEIPELTELYRREHRQTAILEVTLKDGRVFRDQADLPRGHPDNPMSDDEISEKFQQTVSPLLPDAERSELLDRLWHLTDEKDLTSITSLFRRFSAAP